MKIIRPVTINDSTLTSSNIPETDYAEWSSGTTYALGDYVKYTATANVHRIYLSLVGSNLANNPYTGDGTKWLRIGATNRWKMFDASVQSQASLASVIDVVLNSLGRIDSVILLNVSCATARVKQTDAVAGLVYDTTLSMISPSGITDWYSYFFEPIVRKSDVAFTDLLPYNNATIEVILTDTGTVLCGECIVGLSKNVGDTQYGAGIGIQDYSVKSQDAFGNYSITTRAYNKRGNFTVEVLNTFVDELQNMLAGYRADPVVYFAADDYAATLIYGFFKDFDITIAQLTRSICTIEVEGLT